MRIPSKLHGLALAWLCLAAAACGARAELDEGNAPAPTGSTTPQVARDGGGGDGAGDDAAGEAGEARPIPLPPMKPPMPAVVTTVSPPGVGDGGRH